jgi:hypothetical protein
LILFAFVDVEPEGPREFVEEGRLEVDDVGSFPDEEVDERFGVTGTFPKASGSRPTPWAAGALKLPDSCQDKVRYDSR